MKAMTSRRYGGPEVLRLEAVESSDPGPNQLRIRVRASSVNAVDGHFLRGKPVLVRLEYGLLRPKNTILGYDYAGTVDAVGDGVTRFRPGDEVFGGTDGFSLGAFAEYLIVSEHGFVARKPGNYCRKYGI